MKPVFHLAATAFCLSLAVTGPDARAQGDQTLIPSYEAIEIALDDSVESIRFRVLGREFVAQLAQNAAMIRKLPAEDRLALQDVSIWRGSLDGIPGSWIRLVQRGEFVSGTLSDGVTIYRIEPFEHARSRLLSPRPEDEGRLIVYSEQALIGASSDIVVAVEAAAANSLHVPSGDSLLSALKPVMTQGLELDLGVVADREFSEQYGANASATALSQVNDADALIVQQLGIHLTVSALHVFTAEPDPFSSSTPQTLLDQLSAFKGSTPEFLAADLVHLFTRKQLGTSGGNETVGIAILRSVCLATQGVALSSSSNGIVVAHEIGHNLGAPHDGEAGTACASSPPGLMAPILTSQILHRTFSTCSLNQMLQTVATASCLSPIPPADLVASVRNVPGAVSGNQSFSVEFDLINAGAQDLVAIEFTIDSPHAIFDEASGTGTASNVECIDGAVPPICSFNRIAAGTSTVIRVSLNATQLGNIAVGLRGWALNDSDPGNNDATATVNILPAVDLDGGNARVSPTMAIPGQLITINMDIENSGLATATNVRIDARRVDSAFEFVSAEIPGGSGCSIVPPGTFTQCSAPNISAGGSIPATFVYRALSPGSAPNLTASRTLRFQLYAAEPGSFGAGEATLQVTNAVADVELSLSGPGTLRVGQEAVFTIRIENRGPDTARGMELTFEMPGAEQRVPNMPSTCTLGAAKDRVQCTFPGLPAGSSTFVNLGGPVVADGSFTAQATLTVGARDDDPADNVATLGWSATPLPPTATPPPAPPPAASGGGGGGGGGALDPIMVLLLGGAGVFRFVRRKDRSAIGPTRG